jgi:hypothetical protein
VPKLQARNIAFLNVIDLVKEIPDRPFQFMIIGGRNFQPGVFSARPRRANYSQTSIGSRLPGFDSQIFDSAELVLSHDLDQPELGRGQIACCSTRTRSRERRTRSNY